MKIIADVGGTRGRWVLVDKKIIKTVETAGFNPYSYSLSSLNSILDQILSSIKYIRLMKLYIMVQELIIKKLNLVKGLLKNHFKNTQIDVFSDLLGSCRALCNQKKKALFLS